MYRSELEKVVIKILQGSVGQNTYICIIQLQLSYSVNIGVNGAGDAGDISPPIFEVPGI